MRPAILLAAALLWQTAVADTSADPRHMRYMRSVILPQGRSGDVCAVLDANTFAHIASRSGDDLRIFRETATTPVETPFVLTESATQADPPEVAMVLNLGMSQGDIVFDLAMPHRAYTTVNLHLSAENFIATAKVSGSDGDGPKTALGSFALFDLSRQHLSRTTELPLQESTLTLLHVDLRLRNIDGSTIPGLSPSILEGADVPPSREEQTIYDSVAQSSTITQQGARTVAAIHLPEHVPVERASFVLDPGYNGNFLRNVTLKAIPDARSGAAGEKAQVETVSGEISSVQLPPAIAALAPAESKIRRLSVDAVLAANLRSGATIEVTLENGNDAPLPLQSVKLEMRQRMVCFNARAGAGYTLRYGDTALSSPVYDFAKLFQASAKPVLATLGPEQLNPSFIARADDRPFTERHPELLWIGLVAVVAALGATAMQSIKRQVRRG